MKYQLNLLVTMGTTLFVCGCGAEVETPKYENPGSAVISSPVSTPVDSRLSEENEQDSYEKLVPSPEQVEATQERFSDEENVPKETPDETPDEAPEEPSSSDEDSPPETSQNTTADPLENVEVTSEEVVVESSSEIEDTSVSSVSDDVDEEKVQEEVALAREPVMAPRPETVVEKREIKLLVEENSFKKVGKEKALQISYDDIDLLKVLNMEPVPLDAVDHFPRWLMLLDGQRIRIRGFMYPPFQESGIEKFLLARDNDICCFGRDPKIYDIIRVKLKEGTTTNYIPNRPFDVVGRFHITPEAWDDEKLLKLYQIDDAVIVQK